MSYEENGLVGKTVKNMQIANDKQALCFNMEDGSQVIAHCDGDCCSYTWVENIEGADALNDAVVLAVEDIEMPEQDYDESEHECLAFYGCKITTNKGTCVIDYRNESNGYYGGNLSWPEDRHYGGVFGQNVSNCNWEDITE